MTRNSCASSSAREERSRVGDRPRFQFRVELFEIERQILDAAFAELDVRVTDPLRHDRRVPARDLQHFVGHVDADDLSVRPDDLRGDETDFSGPAAEIEHGLALAQIFARIAAAVVAFDHFLRDDL